MDSELASRACSRGQAHFPWFPQPPREAHVCPHPRPRKTSLTAADKLGAAGSPGAGGLSAPGLPLSRAAGWWRSVGFLPPSWSLCEPLRGVGGRPWQAATRGGSAAWGCVHMHVWIVCMRVCVYVCLWTDLCMHVCMCACMCVHMCVPWGKTVHVCVSACMCVCWQIRVCSCVCVHVCMRVCVCRIPADALLCPREEVVL